MGATSLLALDEVSSARVARLTARLTPSPVPAMVAGIFRRVIARAMLEEVEALLAAGAPGERLGGLEAPLVAEVVCPSREDVAVQATVAVAGAAVQAVPAMRTGGTQDWTAWGRYDCATQIYPGRGPVGVRSQAV